MSMIMPLLCVGEIGEHSSASLGGTRRWGFLTQPTLSERPLREVGEHVLLLPRAARFADSILTKERASLRYS